MRARLYCLAAMVALCGAGPAIAAAPERFVFALLGDRTGEVQPGVYEQVWKEAAAGHPAFALTCGDSIQGGKDATAEPEWREVARIWQTNRRLPLYLTP